MAADIVAEGLLRAATRAEVRRVRLDGAEADLAPERLRFWVVPDIVVESVLALRLRFVARVT